MKKVLNIAHRGASSIAPENTLLAASKAFEIGADMWELDVGVSADGALIVIHDDTLVRTTNAQQLFPQREPWNIYDFTLTEIKQLNAGIFYLESDPYEQISGGNLSTQEQTEIAKATIPTFEEVMQFTRQHNWRVNVEIKRLPSHLQPAPIIEKVLAVIDDLDMEQQVIISSFAHSYLQQVKALWPQLKTGALVFKFPDDPIQMLTKLKADALHPWQQAITPAQIDSIRQAGFDVNIYTVNEKSQMEQLIEAGASGLFTDFPQRLHTLKNDLQI